MTEVKRYDPASDDDSAHMTQDRDGEYVRYEDYVALKTGHKADMPCPCGCGNTRAVCAEVSAEAEMRGVFGR